MFESCGSVFLDKEMANPGSTIAGNEGQRKQPPPPDCYQRPQAKQARGCADRVQCARGWLAVLGDVERPELGKRFELSFGHFRNPRNQPGASSLNLCVFARNRFSQRRQVKTVRRKRERLFSKQLIKIFRQRRLYAYQLEVLFDVRALAHADKGGSDAGRRAHKLDSCLRVGRQ